MDFNVGVTFQNLLTVPLFFKELNLLLGAFWKKGCQGILKGG